MKTQFLKVIRTMAPLREGEKFIVQHNGSNEIEWIHRCCDCGLRHTVKTKRTSRNFIFRFWRLPKHKTNKEKSHE